MPIVNASNSTQIHRIAHYLDNCNNNENNCSKIQLNLHSENRQIHFACEFNQPETSSSNSSNSSDSSEQLKNRIRKSSSAKQLTEYRTKNNQKTLSYLDDTNLCNYCCNYKNHLHNHHHHQHQQHQHNTSMSHLPISPLAGPSTVSNDGSQQQQQQSLLPSKMKRNESNASVTFPDELQISRRPSIYLQEIMSTRRPSVVMAAIRSPNHHHLQHTHQRTKIMGSLHENPPRNDSFGSMNSCGSFIHLNMDKNDLKISRNCELAVQSKRKNRRIGDDALSTALSTLYCKLLVIMGVAMPVTEIMSSKIPTHVYHGFYVYLYIGSILFVIFVYATTFKNRALFKILKNYHEKANNVQIRRKVAHFGSFYLRVGAIAFGIGTMVYSGLEFGQYFELNGHPGCRDIFTALTPGARMILSIIQMQFIFLNTTELDMAKHKVIARFGLMHMVATNLCEWLYVLVEETRHEIFHFVHSTDNHHNLNGIKTPSSSASASSSPSPLQLMQSHSLSLSVSSNESNSLEDLLQDFNSTNLFGSGVGGGPIITTFTNLTILKETESERFANCQRTKIMGSLVQDAAPFLFPCTIEYSLICAVILYEMWKKVKSIPDIVKTRRDSMKPTGNSKNAHHFSVDCSRAHRGLFCGIMITVMTIICMIMYFVLYDQPGYESFAMLEVTICETIMYSLTSLAVIAAMIKMRDLKFICKVNDRSSMSLDCTLLVLAQTGVYVYGMFSIMGSYFSIADNIPFGIEGLWAEVIGLIQTSIQTLFILNACWRRCKGSKQQRSKPGRETITFLLVANVSMWFINTLIKGRAAFRKSHLEFFGVWAWTVITHVSMPLAIFYRFHSTICLFEIWKSAYKAKSH